MGGASGPASTTGGIQCRSTARSTTQPFKLIEPDKLYDTRELSPCSRKSLRQLRRDGRGPFPARDRPAPGRPACSLHRRRCQTAPARSRACSSSLSATRRASRGRPALDYVGSDELVQQINAGWLEFDATIAMADQMGKVGGLGRMLGRRGLMPNPRSGTVVRDAEDLPRVSTSSRAAASSSATTAPACCMSASASARSDDDKSPEHVRAGRRRQPRQADAPRASIAVDHADQYNGSRHPAGCHGRLAASAKQPRSATEPRRIDSRRRQPGQ